MTLLAVSIMVDAVDTAIAQISAAAARGADLVELRIDRMDNVEQITKLVDRSALPCIVTCRAAWEGGECEADEHLRVVYLGAAAESDVPPAYIDIELAAMQRDPQVRQCVEHMVDHPDQPHPSSTALILSSHDFQTRPTDLLQRVEAMANIPSCRVIKLAWRARSLRDNLEAFELLRASHKPTIALCMGEFGLPSRVLAKKFGGLLTFAGLNDSTTTAPGQVGITTLKNTYRWDHLNAETRVFGVVGWPVGHSMSPAIHNAGFDAVDFNGVYLPMPIPPEYEHFKATIGAWLDEESLHFRGASVTIPHKENLLRFVREEGGQIDPLAAKIGAANTLHRGEDGTLRASNTDCGAILDSACEGLACDRDALQGKVVAVLGAGGAARAAIAGFADCGATVTIYNRTAAKAAALADEFVVEHLPWSETANLNADIVINCTPIGMHPNVDDTPLPDWPASLGSESLVFDTVYNPIETKLLQQAKAAGCKTVSGITMFVKQAAEQFEQWTSKPAPVSLFEQIVREKLKA